MVLVHCTSSQCPLSLYEVSTKSFEKFWSSLYEVSTKYFEEFWSYAPDKSGTDGRTDGRTETITISPFAFSSRGGVGGGVGIIKIKKMGTMI